MPNQDRPASSRAKIVKPSNEELIRDIRSIRALLRKPVIAFRADWIARFDHLVEVARARNLQIKGVTVEIVQLPLVKP